MKLLWVEDERRLVEEGAFFLQQEGCVIHHAPSAEEALLLLERQRYDLLLIDWMLPGRQGIELCKEARRQWQLPVIMLTAKTEEENKVLALDNGADDYVTKPFGIRELFARMKAVLRRTGSAQPAAGLDEECIRSGALAIYPLRHEAQLNGTPLALTPTEFRLLLTLAEQPGRVFSRLQLLDLVLGDAYAGFERTMDSHVRNLRRKLGEDPDEPHYIRTVYGVGYKFRGGAE